MCDEVIFRLVTNAEMFSAYNGTGYRVLLICFTLYYQKFRFSTTFTCSRPDDLHAVCGEV